MADSDSDSDDSVADGCVRALYTVGYNYGFPAKLVAKHVIVEHPEGAGMHIIHALVLHYAMLTPRRVETHMRMCLLCRSGGTCVRDLTVDRQLITPVISIADNLLRVEDADEIAAKIAADIPAEVAA
jgi:hypothetical protein